MGPVRTDPAFGAFQLMPIACTVLPIRMGIDKFVNGRPEPVVAPLRQEGAATR